MTVVRIFFSCILCAIAAVVLICSCGLLLYAVETQGTPDGFTIYFYIIDGLSVVSALLIMIASANYALSALEEL